MNQSKAFVSFDLLFAVLPLLLMISYLFSVIWLATETAEQSLHSAEITGKLATIADYLVKRGAVERTRAAAFLGNKFIGTATYSPNVIDDAELDFFKKQKQEEIRNWMGLERLEVSWEQGEGNCVYRLVLSNDELKKLYVCGG